MRRAATLAALALALLAGCPAPGAGPAAGGATGGATGGSARPERIVSLAPNVTETLFALGAGDRIVGVTTYCDHPEAARALPKVGDYSNPSLELIVGAKADLVVTPAEGLTRPLVERLRSLGIAVHVFDTRDFDSTLAAIGALGDAVGAPEAARAVGDRLRAASERARAAAARGAGPATLFVLDRGPLVLAGPGSLAHDLLVRCGARNVAEPLGDAYPRPTTETLLGLAPDVVIDAAMNAEPDATADALAFWREHAPTLPAVKRGRVVAVDPDLLNRAGPRLADGLDALRRALYPEPAGGAGTGG